jgi:beta-mannanase
MRRALLLVAAATIWVTWVPLAEGASGPVPLPPTGKVYFGTYSPPTGSWTKEAQKAEYTTLETRLGRGLDIGHYYYQWGAAFPTWRETWHVQSGRIPLISWAHYDTDAIRSGSQDAVIRARADAVRDFGSPVFLRPLWEMDGDWTRSWIRSPQSFIDAWRHIVTIFRSRGATNATFVWCPTAWGFATGEAQQYYPGSAYVDWVCADAYNWAPGRPGAKWRSLSEAVQPFYTWALTMGKPMMLGEYGCQERGAGEKAAWFNQAQSDLKASFPAIRAVVYFDAATRYDWRVDTSSSSFAAFKAMGADPYFNP